jgi:hypothetical protein
VAGNSSSNRSGLGGPTRAHRRFAAWLVGVVVFIVSAFALVNTRVDPLWVTHVDGWTDDAHYAEYRQIFRSLRTAKAGLATADDWEVAFVGSSRVAIALDPAMPQWGDRKVVNLGLSGASMSEHLGVIRYLLEKQENVKTVYLGVDLTDLTTDTDLSRNAGFYESRFHSGGDTLNRELQYLFGSSSFKASMETIRNRFRVERAEKIEDPIKRDEGILAAMPPYTPLGHWLRHRSGRPTRDIIFTDSVPLALRMIRQRHAQLEIFPKKLEALKAIMKLCQDQGVELKLLIPPNHAVYHAVFYLANDADPGFRIDRETVLKLVADSNAAHPSAPPITVWDFNDFHGLNAEALPPLGSDDITPKYWADGTHALDTLGHVMLKRMNGWPIEDETERGYGRQIDLSNLEDRLHELRAGYERYRDENPDEIKWLSELMEKYSKTGSESLPGEQEILTPAP